MLNDLRFALRQLLKSRGFTAVAVLTLALGIGATTAIFSVVNAVLLQPLDYPAAERIVTVWSFNNQKGTRYQVSSADFRDWHAQSQSFAGLTKYSGSETGVVTAGVAEKLMVAAVSPDFATVMGVKPRSGRHFTAEEARIGGVAFVSEGFARRHFNGEPERALGATLKVHDRSLQIVGVLPAAFAFPARAEVWYPVDTIFAEAPNRSAHNYRLLGRLRDGVTVEQAQREMTEIGRRLEQQYPQTNTNKGIAVVPLQDYLVRNHKTTLWIMLSAVGLVLLIACANVANLLLARGAAREREVCIRAALGASPWRIVRGLLAESAVLAALSGIAGLLLAAGGVRALVALAPSGIPRLDQVGLDAWTLLFAVLISIVVCFLAGLMPSLHSARIDLTTALRSGGRGLISGGGRLRSMLVVAQIAISLTLLTGAGLLLRSFQLLNAVDPGYRTEKVLVMQGSYSAGDEVGARRAVSYYADIVREAAALPGMVSVSAAGGLPIDESGSNGAYIKEGQPMPPAPDVMAKQNAAWHAVAPGFFGTLGIALKSGREFDSRDAYEAQFTVVINESMAKAGWPDQDPIGRRIAIGWDARELKFMTIVGVVADVKQVSLDAPVGQALYVPVAQHPLVSTDLKIIARTSGAPEAQTESLRRIAQRINPEVPLKFTTAEILIADTLTAPRFRALLIGTFAVVALILSVVGVASVMACVVAERRAEIGIRMALGAQPEDVVRHFTLRGLRLAGIGLALGAMLALVSARFLQGLLYGIGANDPLVFAGVTGLLLVAALGACIWPSRRAAKVDPLVVLRSD